MQLILRRAEPADASSIHLITRDETGEVSQLLRKRYGDQISVPALIDASPLSIVATDPTETYILGFCAFCNGPPRSIDIMRPDTSSKTGSHPISAQRGPWDQWVRSKYETKDILIHNTKFLSFFVAMPDHQLAFLDAALTTVFSLIPTVRHVCYLLPDSISLFPPLSSPKFVLGAGEQEQQRGTTPAPGNSQTTKGRLPNRPNVLRRRAKHHHLGGGSTGGYFTDVQVRNGMDAPFALQVCNRKDVYPPLKVRRARVEDCDDLVPMFKKQNLLHGKKADHYLAELLESKSDANRTLVAEVDGSVVGFMSLTKDIDHEILTKCYDLQAFDNLVKDVPPELLATANGEVSTETDDNNDPAVADDSMMDESYNAAKAAAKVAAAQAAQAAAMAAAKALREQQNVFCISLLCIEDNFANQAIEFVKAAFTLFPDRDYCVVTVPTTLPEIPLLRNFTAVYPKSGRITSSHCLYLLNRFGVGELVTIKRAKNADTVAVADLVQGLKVEGELMRRFRDSIEDIARGVVIVPPFTSYIAELGGQAVGIIILDNCTNPETICDQFDVEYYVDLNVNDLQSGPTIVKHCVLNPLFAHQAKWFIEEVMRQAAVTCLLYPVDESTGADPSSRMLLVKEMVPVKRRRQINFKDNLRDGVSVPPPLLYNLQLTTVSLLYEPKITVNTRIVVVGGSDIGKAFLERLVYSSHLYFPNLTLISTAGVPSIKNENAFVSNLCYNATELKQLGLDSYVQVVRSSAVEFDRVLKRVRIDNDAYIMYDYLFLTPGVQFFAAKVSDQFGSLEGVVNLSERDVDLFEKGVIKVLARKDDPQLGHVVVYGRSLQALVTIEVLLGRGIPPTHIVLVIPTHHKPSGTFDNRVVEAKVMERLQNLGITVHKNYKIISHDTNATTLASIKIWSREEKTELTIIDKYFRTQDPYIYAAGSITKYSSKYQTKWSHVFYDSKEVGTKLAETVMSLFDPTWIPEKLIEDEDLLHFNEAKKVFCNLPGGIKYFHFDEPRLPSHTLEFRRQQESYGRDLIIDNEENGYFRIHVDKQGFIKSMTYLGTRPIPVDNLLCLYGLHEKYLNRLVSRFDEGIISDFVRTNMLQHESESIKGLVEALKDIGVSEDIAKEEREDMYI
ncbi:hypothetical protein HDU76_012035 [Blyttiomyces sp. JEL0837]|nr:hypothetical protein HDU76_012035 [Blyttiomyces sp. JEL0837]